MLSQDTLPVKGMVPPVVAQLAKYPTSQTRARHPSAQCIVTNISLTITARGVSGKIQKGEFAKQKQKDHNRSEKKDSPWPGMNLCSRGHPKIQLDDGPKAKQMVSRTYGMNGATAESVAPNLKLYAGGKMASVCSSHSPRRMWFALFHHNSRLSVAG
ncbi:hypothetical protein BC832DRAFT_346221 [Gaertneriomyces semiglobifer]|nr:hypothetical protein BC832DRAFT_346221 [Gaertneriomyces semiglobifer]